MPFISTSNNAVSADLASNPLAIINDLHLVFKFTLHRSSSFRDLFTRLLQNPRNLFAPKSQTNHVLRGLSFRIHRNDRIGLLGVNGTGKTSLCRCLSGHYTPTRGEVRVAGKVQAVFATAMGVLPDLTGRENALLLAQFLYPEYRREHRQLVEEVLEFSELGKSVDLAFKFYSAGMQARLYLSLISCRPTDLLILDEVFEGADSFFKNKISERIQRMIELSGAAIFVSHSPEQIRRVCNRVLVLREGHITFDGAVDEGLKFYEAAGPSKN